MNISNQPKDIAQETIDRLGKDYALLVSNLNDAINATKGLPEVIDNDEDMGTVAAAIKNLRDMEGRIEGVRVAEKEPHLRSGNAVDNFFKGLIGRIVKSKRTDADGAVDTLQARVNRYIQKKADEERRRRQEEADRARAEERRIAAERQAAEQRQRDEEAAAARARKPESVAVHAQAAEDAALTATQARREHERATTVTDEALAAAAAPTADLVRTRTDTGHLVTAKQEPQVTITDAAMLDAAALWPFVKEDHKLQALKQWAKINQYRRQMPGAVIALVDRAVIR